MGKLRYIVVYDEKGVIKGPQLQVWDDDIRRWVDVRTVECDVLHYSESVRARYATE